MLLRRALTNEQSNALQIVVHVAGTISSLSGLGFFAVLYRDKSLQTPINYLVCWMEMADFIISVCLGLGLAPLGNAIACYAQGIFVEFSFVAAANWNFVIALHCYLTVCSKKSSVSGNDRIFICYHLYAWGTAVFFTGSMFLVEKVLQRGPIIGSATLECWISSNYKEYRVYLFYAMLWVQFVVGLILYFLVFLKVNAQAKTMVSSSSTGLTKSKKVIVMKAVAFAAVQFISWLPASASRILVIYNQPIPFWLYCLQAITGNGILSFLVPDQTLSTYPRPT
ncbi:hypothetical protein BC830DRAFT_891082 [Chytriomyces sp. MP71]|nr:hypothetical protein BC830DRAFT_891082 [Chytriomyces sp. MP71]